jgi:hypothetical protein
MHNPIAKLAVISLTLLPLSAVATVEPKRASIAIQLTPYQTELIRSPNGLSGQDLLKSLGITTDIYSRIYVHEEDSSIELDCFDCVVNHLHEDQLAVSPVNDKGN